MQGGALVQPDQIVVKGEKLSLLQEDFPLFWLGKHDVELVREKEYGAIVRDDRPNLLQPRTQVQKRVQTRYVKHKNYGERTSIIVRRHWLISFTSCRVPQLQLHQRFVM